jgi:hypothetical protein
MRAEMKRWASPLRPRCRWCWGRRSWCLRWMPSEQEHRPCWMGQCPRWASRGTGPISRGRTAMLQRVSGPGVVAPGQLWERGGEAQARCSFEWVGGSWPAGRVRPELEVLEWDGQLEQAVAAVAAAAAEAAPGGQRASAAAGAPWTWEAAS